MMLTTKEYIKLLSSIKEKLPIVEVPIELTVSEQKLLLLLINSILTDIKKGEK